MSRFRLIIGTAVVVAVLIAGGFAVGRLSTPQHATPGQNSAEAGFARDMQVHHSQAVELAFLIRDRSTDKGIRLLAYDIATSQSQQNGQMFGWLAEWGLAQAASEPSMTWMTRPALDGSAHEHDDASPHTPGEPMPGLATPEQLTALAATTGVDAEIQFLELMIAHHAGGVEMAKALLARSDYNVVTNLATSIVNAQSSEIDVMQGLLDARR